MGACRCPAAPAFDFGGQHGVATNPVLFPNVLTNYASFLELAQQLEDAAVRLYLGQLPMLASEKLLYRAALAMQATEARHASHIRSLRRAQGTVVKNWPQHDRCGPARPRNGAHRQRPSHPLCG